MKAPQFLYKKPKGTKIKSTNVKLVAILCPTFIDHVSVSDHGYASDGEEVKIETKFP